MVSLFADTGPVVGLSNAVTVRAMTLRWVVGVGVDLMWYTLHAVLGRDGDGGEERTAEEFVGGWVWSFIPHLSDVHHAVATIGRQDADVVRTIFNTEHCWVRTCGCMPKKASGETTAVRRRHVASIHCPYWKIDSILFRLVHYHGIAGRCHHRIKLRTRVCMTNPKLSNSALSKWHPTIRQQQSSICVRNVQHGDT